MEKDRQRSNQYSKTPEGRQKQKLQKRKYLPMVRHFDSVLDHIMDDTEILSLHEISERAYESKKVKIKPRTIENLLARYTNKFGSSPLEKVEGQNYKLNTTFYKSR